jgi:hypothetical protein
VGLGRKSCFPPRPRLGPVIVSRPSTSNGHAWNPDEQKRDRHPHVNPRVHVGSFSLPRAAPCRSSPRDGTATGPLTGARARRCVDTPPSSGSSAEPYPRTAASERPRSSVDERRGGGWHRREPSHRHTHPPMGGRAAVERLLGRALPARPWRVPSPQPQVAARDLPTRRADPSTVGGGGHRVNTKK